jgi:hypothetical protein
MNDYIRTMNTNQYYGSLHNNGITYQDFLNGGFYINGFDLTTSKEGGATAFTVPSVLKGMYSLAVSCLVFGLVNRNNASLFLIFFFQATSE